MEHASDDEVAAAIAHEMGHLLSDGHMQGPVALRGDDKGLDVEAKADAVGCNLLEMHGISRSVMMQMLQLVADDPSTHQGCDDLCRRICRLRAADKSTFP
jgi:predicted Zn-dependent protease